MSEIAIATSAYSASSGSILLKTLFEAQQGIGGRAVSASTVWEDFVKPTAEGIRLNQLLTFRNLATLSPYNISVDTTFDKYFGGYLKTGLQLTVPDDIAVTREYIPAKGSRTYKEFQKLKNDGHIVLTDRKKGMLSVTAKPGIYVHGLTKTGEATGQHVLPGLYSSVATYNGMKPYDEASDTVLWQVPQTAFKYEIFNMVSKELVHPIDLDGISRWLHEVGLALDELQPDAGLVATARADAAAGVMDILTTLAEAPQTVRSIFDAIKLIAIKYLETRRKVGALYKNKIGNEKILDAVASLWLQFRYAIMPNVYTIEDGLKYLDAVVVEYITIRLGQKLNIELPKPDGYIGDSHVETIERVFLKNRIDVENLKKADALLARNGLVTIWELVPLSFVLDWAFNIGDLLSALFKPKGSIQEAATSSFHCVDQTIILTHPDYIGATLELNVGYYRANVINPADHIGLKAALDMNLRRWADAAALVWSATSTPLRSEIRSSNRKSKR